MIVRRVEALGRFLETEDGATLLALVRRALNILKIEEKKDARSYDGTPAAKLLKEKEEKALNAAIGEVGEKVADGARVGGFRGSHGGARQTPRAGRRLLRQGHRERGRSRSPAEPADATRSNPRAHAPDRGLLEDRGID